MNENIDKEIEKDIGNYLEIGRTNDLHSNEIRRVDYIIRTKQNSIPAEQFEEAGQQVSTHIRKGDHLTLKLGKKDYPSNKSNIRTKRFNFSAINCHRKRIYELNLIYINKIGTFVSNIKKNSKTMEVT